MEFLAYWGLVDLAKVKLLDANPRKSHRLGALAASLRRHGFGSPITINKTTDRILAGNGRIRALRRMKRSGEEPPDGVTIDGRRWMIPALYGAWPEADETAVALALNGGVDGSLEGDLDRDLVADFLTHSTDAAREALGLSNAQATQYTLDHAAPVLPPQINLEGLQRTEAAEETEPSRTVKVLLTRPTAARLLAAIRDGNTADAIITRGLADAKKTNGP